MLNLKTNKLYLKSKLNQVSVCPELIESCYARYLEMQFCIQLYIDIWRIISYLSINLYRIKTKLINSLIFRSTIIK